MNNFFDEPYNDLVVLGVESTAHTFGVSVIKGSNVLSNIRKNFTTTSGGMIPSKVADHHVDFCDSVFVDALKKANITVNDIDLIAFSASPGIGHTLKVGAVFSRSLALLLHKPLIPVNHCVAHLEVGRILTGCSDPIMLYASGANTQVIGFESGKYRVFGETLDNGVGNFLDSFGRYLDLGFPAGPKIELLSSQGKTFVELPYVVKGMDVSFGGLLTNVKEKYDSGNYSKEDLCFSVQETVFAMLVEVAERALAHTGKKELVLGGGVACNKRFQEMCKIMCDARGARFFCPSPEFLIDNAAMIALTGLLKYSYHKKDLFSISFIDPYQRTDDVDIEYR